MRVTDVSATPVSVPVESALQTSKDDADGDTYDHVVVRVTLADGTEGFGEVAPHPTWPRAGTQATCLSLLRDTLAARVVSTDVYHARRTVRELERTVSGLPYPVAGLDVALHDALGRLVDRPVYDLLGGPVTDERTLELHYTVGIKPLPAFREEVVEAAESGYDAFKLKVGRDSTAERERLRALREAVPGARIRVDANGAWTAAEAITQVRALDEAAGGLAFVEQPVPADDYAGLTQVRERTGVPVLADESCYSAADVATLARHEAADIVNLKLANAGGIGNAVDAAKVAEAHGLAGFAGGMLELGVGAAASAHFAVATPTIRYPTGILNRFAAHMLIENDAEWEPEGPEFVVPDGPGLGVTVDREAVERYRTN